MSRSSCLSALVLLGAISSLTAADNDTKLALDSSTQGKPWTVIQRGIGEGRDQGRYWQIDYLMRNDGPTAQTLKPEEVSAVISATVSNSRIPGHACPRQTRLVVSGKSGLSAECDVIPSADESRRCRERVVLQVWPANLGPNPPDPVAKAVVRLVALREQPTPTIPVGGLVRVRLRLEHDHFLYGPYDPLLGLRTLELTLGSAKLKDALPLDRATDLPRRPMGSWPGGNDPPADRRDARVYISAPDSLHLEAHVAGNQSYRFKECQVHYGTKMRLRYWYLIAPGTEGEAKATIVQYKDAPTAWKILSDGDVVQIHTTMGRWVKVEKTFRTEPEATSLTLEFRLPGDIGEMWIDDISLEPTENDNGGP